MTDNEESSHESDSEAVGPDEYVVEKIVDHKTRKGETTYLIKWKGWSESENTWEPEDHLDCDELLSEYKAKNMTKKPRKKAQPKTTQRKRKRRETDEESSPAPSGSISGKEDVATRPNRVAKKKARQISDDEQEEEEVDQPTKSDKPRVTVTHFDTSDSEDDEPPKNNAQSTSSVPSPPAAKSSATPITALDIREDPSIKAHLEPERIIGATESSGQLMFLIKWKNMNKADLVSAKVCKIACPHTVINFFEEKICWDKEGSKENHLRIDMSKDKI